MLQVHKGVRGAGGAGGSNIDSGHCLSHFSQLWVWPSSGMGVAFTHCGRGLYQLWAWLSPGRGCGLTPPWIQRSQQNKEPFICVSARLKYLYFPHPVNTFLFSSPHDLFGF